jgi:hypothetical protein
MANSEREWRLEISDWWMTFLEGKKWEGEAPAEPKLIGKSAGRQIGKSEKERQRIATGE